MASRGWASTTQAQQAPYCKSSYDAYERRHSHISKSLPPYQHEVVAPKRTTTGLFTVYPT